MKKINLKGLNEVLSERELKNVIGGTGSNSGSGHSSTCYECMGGTTGNCCEDRDCLEKFNNDCPAGGTQWSCWCGS